MRLKQTDQHDLSILQIGVEITCQEPVIFPGQYFWSCSEHVDMPDSDQSCS